MKSKTILVSLSSIALFLGAFIMGVSSDKLTFMQYVSMILLAGGGYLNGVMASSKKRYTEQIDKTGVELSCKRKRINKQKTRSI